MTLLEMLVALAIFALMATALFPVIQGALRTRNEATARMEIDREARAILDRLEADVAGNIDAGFPGQAAPRFLAPAPSGHGDDSEHVILETTTLVARGVTAVDGFVGGEDTAALAIDRGDQAHVLWRIDAEGRLVRQEVRPPAVDPVDWSTVPSEVLSDRAGVELEFFDAAEWLESWDSTDTGTNHNRAPAAVRTTLRLDDGAAPLELVSTVVLPVLEVLPEQRAPAGAEKPSKPAKSTGGGKTSSHHSGGKS
jgi:type II secretion system protein J